MSRLWPIFGYSKSMPPHRNFVESCKRPFNHHYRSNQSGPDLISTPLTVQESGLLTLLFRIVGAIASLQAGRRPEYRSQSSRLFHISFNPVRNSTTRALGIPHCWITATSYWRVRTSSFFFGNPKHQPTVYGNR